MKATVVPNRNMVMIALATAFAISRKANFVAYAAHAGDHAIYPDCRPEFIDHLSKAIDHCDYNPPALVAPFAQKTKAEIVELGFSLRVPFHLTHTCYEGKAIACGRCGTCVERLEAFSLVGREDPLQYADTEYWKTVLEVKQ
jgi:7-cyano-7-deazaguanine synthase